MSGERNCGKNLVESYLENNKEVEELKALMKKLPG